MKKTKQCYKNYKFIKLIKTVGLCPTTLRFFEKNRVKLLSKRNYIAFFGKKYIELFQKYHGSAMIFYKSLGQAFLKACGVLGQCPKVLDKFIFIPYIPLTSKFQEPFPSVFLPSVRFFRFLFFPQVLICLFPIRFFLQNSL